MTNGRFKKTLGALFILVTLALIFLAGAYLGQATQGPQVIIAYEIHTVDKVTGEVAHEPGETVIFNRIENSNPLRNFQDLEELQRWLENTKVHDIGSDVADKEINQSIKSFDCDDYALKLQKKALRDGYIVSFEVIHPSEYGDLFKQGQIPEGTIHAINSVIIGNEVYYIEPKTNEIVFVAYLD